MKKKKLVLTKETVKNLTLDSEELGEVAGGARSPLTAAAGYGGTGFCPNTGSTCHSCGSSCLACLGTNELTIYINPPYLTGG